MSDTVAVTTTIHDPLFYVCGDTWQLLGNLQDSAGNALDLTGAQSITWRLDDAAGVNRLTLTLGAGIALTGQPTTGQVLVKPSPTQTAALVPGVFTDSIRVVLADGSVTTQWEGTITASPAPA